MQPQHAEWSLGEGLRAMGLVERVRLRKAISETAADIFLRPTTRVEFIDDGTQGSLYTEFLKALRRLRELG